VRYVLSEVLVISETLQTHFLLEVGPTLVFRVVFLIFEAPKPLFRRRLVTLFF
jgi:hypothetical protein